MSPPSPVMESPRLIEDDGEECNSNESGWTMYLASPTHSDDVRAIVSEGSNVEDGSGFSNERRRGKENKGHANDDGDYDSLASDASTGPAEVKMQEGKEEKDHQMNGGNRHQHAKDEQDEIPTKLSTSYSKKVGKIKKGDEKTSRRGQNKRRSSSRTSFFW
ncbi:protein SOB FIVE-LIKE 4-like [Oryza sativa Japonica Group]|jgi:hypothetical protein|uniref:Uncharacterized protein n=7 Tax=Oryza TaxID=4527 RepID=A0A8J8XDV4_ORYSJ|nr:hypothetical protein OsJ_29728 [Oryza sativa Japonica Group]KAB8110969.1 hypothetical protein EE612_048474 [Oryza sativa]KAF2916651.1 hypothetical protein DAI22_09g135500 [Oryza sativa Japonica Group]BAT08584.1 Os09g0473600 [Oryza sativa Japonica Group]